MFIYNLVYKLSDKNHVIKYILLKPKHEYMILMDIPKGNI